MVFYLITAKSNGVYSVAVCNLIATKPNKNTYSETANRVATTQCVDVFDILPLMYHDVLFDTKWSQNIVLCYF